MEFQNLLQQSDYSLVLPNENLKPLGLILQKNRNIFQLFTDKEGSAVNASLKDLFQKKGRGLKYPKVKETKLPTELAGSDIVKGGGHFAANLLTKGSGTAGLNKAKTVLFTFKNAKKHIINQIQLDEYLQFAKLNEYSPTFSEAVKDGKMYIVIEALTSPELILRNADDFNVRGQINAQVIDDYANAKAGASIDNSQVYRIKNEGETPLIFAIKTARILFKDGIYRLKPTTINVRSTNNKGLEILDEGSELIFE